MKILVVGGKFPVLSHTFVVNQAQGLLDLGHDVKVLELSKEDRPDFLPDHPLRKAVVETTDENEQGVLAHFEVVIAEWGNFGAQMLEKKKKYQQKWKLVTFFRGYDISRYLLKNPGYLDDLLQEGDLFCTSCENFRQRVIKLGAAADKVHVIYSSVNCNIFSNTAERTYPLAPERIRLITVGRLVPKKGFEFAIRAVAKLVQSLPTIEYIIVGDPHPETVSYAAELRQLTTDLQLTEKVSFVGPKTSAEIRDLHAQSDIFVCPCITAADGDVDSMPNVVKEALLCRLPVVASSVSGIPEMVEDGVTGILVPEQDTEAIVNGVKKFVENWDWARKLAECGNDRIRSVFHIPIQAKALDGLLKKIK